MQFRLCTSTSRYERQTEYVGRGIRAWGGSRVGRIHSREANPQGQTCTGMAPRRRKCLHRPGEHTFKNSHLRDKPIPLSTTKLTRWNQTVAKKRHTKERKIADFFCGSREQPRKLIQQSNCGEAHSYTHHNRGKATTCLSQNGNRRKSRRPGEHAP